MVKNNPGAKAFSSAAADVKNNVILWFPMFSHGFPMVSYVFLWFSYGFLSKNIDVDVSGLALEGPGLKTSPGSAQRK